MPINILMPALSPTMEKGNLAKWLKKEGDKVKSGDVIAEIETDKATMEVEAVDEGTLGKIVVPEGTADVPVNQVIAVLAGEGEDVKAAAARKAGAAPQQPPKPKQPPQAPQPATAAARPATSRSRPRQPSAPAACAERAAGASGGNRIFASPLARRLAKEAGIDLSRIDGSGPHGRVIARDVDAAKSGKGLRGRGRAARPRRRRRRSRRRCPTSRSARCSRRAATRSCRTTACAAPSRSASPQSKQTIPHFYLTIDCNIGKLLAAREEINAVGAEGQGRQARLQALGQRLRHQGAGARAAARARRQRELDRRRHAQAQAFRRRRRGRDAGRPDHADRPQRRDQVAVGDLQRDEGPRGARPRPQAQAARIPGRHHRGVQPRHVRHQGLHRGDQPAARHHPCGRRRRGARGRA